MARNDLQVNFRIPAELKHRLEAAAKDAGRSITAELVQRLEDSFREKVDIERYREIMELQNKNADLLRYRAEQANVSVLASNLVATQLVAAVFKDKKLPADVAEVVSRSTRLTEQVKAWLHQADAEEKENNPA